MGIQAELSVAEQERSVFFRGISNHVAARRARIRGRLQEVVKATIEDRAFRRQLQAHAPQALRRFGYYQTCVPSRLSVPEALSAYFAEKTLFADLEESSADVAPLDVRLVYYGARDLALHFGSDETLRQYAAWAESRSLVTLLTPHGRRSGQPVGNGSVERHQSGPVELPNGYRGLIVASSERQAELAWLSLLCGWKSILLRMLGIPSCCYRQDESWLWACSNDQICKSSLPAFPNSGAFEWYCNVFGGYFGHPLLCHVPCRFDCRASRAAALWYLNRLRIYEPEYVTSLPARLASVAVQAGPCVCIFPGAVATSLATGEYAIDYEPEDALCTTPESNFARIVRGSSKMLWRKDELSIGETTAFGCKLWIFTRGADPKQRCETSRAADALKKRRREKHRFLPRVE